MPAWLLKLLMSFIPEPDKLFKLIVFVVLIPIVVIIMFFSLPANLAKNVPLAAPSQVKIYMDIAKEVGTGKVEIDWTDLLAIDAARLDNNFKKTDIGRIKFIANKFIIEEKKKVIEKQYDPVTDSYIDIETEITVYKKKPLDELLNELVIEGILKPQNVADVYNFKSFNIATLQDAGDGSDMPPNWTPIIGIYQWPIPDVYKITSKFGPRVDPVEGIDGFHKGIDIGASQGKPIIAVKDGYVKSAGFLGFNSGNGVIIVHNDGSQTRYYHMSRVSVFRLQEVKVGDKIGEVGSTGKSTGPHLHFEILIGGTQKDPLLFFTGMK